ncbi:PREDICTED: uncharacterized protein DDB_G0290685-like [Eufriesea mexicana]|uniref:uncharacterized protein DDB_G0290685-like n=1 Tax=Eufriesea mexicana TaxID=516756 RepID=UPI00083BF46D|nr:PREDICTED: uncharacterized protein DDB_G0290685-like [Eufriesea mexicana]
MKCFKCREHGHIASECKNELRSYVYNISEGAREKCLKEVQMGEYRLVALIDTGSDLNLMRAKHYVKIGAPRLRNSVLEFRGVGEGNNRSLGESSTIITIDRTAYPINVHVVPDALTSQDLIIGTEYLETVEVNFKRGEISIKDLGGVGNSVVSSVDIEPEVNQVDSSRIIIPENRKTLEDEVVDEVVDELVDEVVDEVEDEGENQSKDEGEKYLDFYHAGNGETDAIQKRNAGSNGLPQVSDGEEMQEAVLAVAIGGKTVDKDVYEDDWKNKSASDDEADDENDDEDDGKNDGASDGNSNNRNEKEDEREDHEAEGDDGDEDEDDGRNDGASDGKDDDEDEDEGTYKDKNKDEGEKDDEDEDGWKNKSARNDEAEGADHEDKGEDREAEDKSEDDGKGDGASDEKSDNENEDRDKDKDEDKGEDEEAKHRDNYQHPEKILVQRRREVQNGF